DVQDRAQSLSKVHVLGPSVWCLKHLRAAASSLSSFTPSLPSAPATRPGLKSGQFSLLMSLNRPRPPTLGSVAELLAMDRTTLTANLKPLERDGLIEVRPDEKDRRARRLVLTEKGQSLLVSAVPVWTRTHRAIESALAAGVPDRLRADLVALLSAPEP